MTNAGTNLFRIALDELGTVLARVDESPLGAARHTHMEQASCATS
ncbi:hypothetical protein [Mesorhizobium mediterraneum]|nr:hypothetical protein [Mesorhizobium mediterraneum]